MSLFKSREWWSTNCGIDETFGDAHMCIAKYESAISGVVKQIIIVGSLEGYLRIYDPQPPSSSSADESSCSSDLQLETQLALPILAILSGRFNNTEGLHIAVLHPKHLRVLRVIINENTQLHSHCTVDFMYEHKLPLHGYTLIAGPSNTLCVQSLTEGTLMFFENERVGVSFKLPTLHLLPSPMCYVSSTESFVVCDSSWILHSYNYQSLANSTVEGSRASSTSNKLLSDWELELGEQALDVQYIGTSIVTLSERHLYCLKDIDGTILWTRKLDYHPMCCTTLIPPDSPDSVVVLVCTDAHTLLVYKDNLVEWSCKLPTTPIVIKISTLQSIKGLIVSLSDVGQLNVLYMGTQQVQYGFLHEAPKRPVNYERGLKEIQQMTKSLRSGQLKDCTTLNTIILSVPQSVDNKLQINTVTPKQKEMELDLKLESVTCSEYLETQQIVQAIKGQFTIAMSKNPQGNIRVLFNCDALVIATPSETCLQLNTVGEAAFPVMFHAVLSKRGTVASLRVEVTAVAGTFSITRHFNLPLQLVTSLSVPVREAQIKVTLSTNQLAVSLVHLFQDFPVEDSMSNVIALKHLDGTIVSLLVSKTTNKYRLQSDSLAALALLIDDLQRRLRLHFSDAANLQVNLDSSIPMQELWNQVESHYTNYTDLKKEMMKLGQTSRQFHIIQRFFHNKVLNSKTVGFTQDAFTAMQLAQDHVTSCVQRVELFQEKLKSTTYSLEGSLKCVLSLLKMETDSANKRNVDLLEKTLLPVEQLNIDQSWQEDVENKLNYLVKQRSHSTRTAPVIASKSAREFNLINFKKIFVQAFDNLIKGFQP